ncbi:MAG: hypothetical protein KDA65_12350 [Planctomycetaceae bacterium]|nr:hypothetical protein [Planctomycetaceae bacterium]
MISRLLIPICSLALFFIFLPGCNSPSQEGDTEESTGKVEEQNPPSTVAQVDSAPAEPVDQYTSEPIMPFAEEQLAIINAWKANAEKYNKLKAVLQVEYISPPIYNADKTEAELLAEQVAVQPEDYTIKEWQDSIWVEGEQFRYERETTRLLPTEYWPNSQLTYDGERELHTLILPKDESASPQGATDARSPEELNDYWPLELESFYKLVRNVDDHDHLNFWDSISVDRQEEYDGEECLVVKVGETDQIEYIVSPAKNYQVVKWVVSKEDVAVATSEIKYRKSDNDWFPTNWTTIEMKEGDKGPYTVKARQANVTVSEWTPNFTDDRSDLYALAFPPGTALRMWGSSDTILVAAEEPESDEFVPDPTTPVDVDAVVKKGVPDPEDEVEGLPATHEPVNKLIAEYNGKRINLNTFCLDQQGNILLSCGGEVRQLVLSEEEKKLLQEEGENAQLDATIENKESVVLVYSPELEFVKAIPIPFKATALTPFNETSILVAGEGRLARVDHDGKVLHSGSSPQIEDIDTYREQVIAQVKQERAEFRERFKEDLELYQQQLEGLEKVKEEDRSRGQKRTIEVLRTQITLFEQQLKFLDSDEVDPQLEMMLQMKLRVPSLSVTAQDIFVTVPSTEGYGYEVWRVDHEFKNPAMILSDLRGCCGQMDVFARDDKLYVAENSRFRVASFDRDGEKIGSFGKSDRTSKQGFGSCCNPMNVRCCSNGDVLTAESSVGNIKRFSPEGELLANIGHVQVTGGCKNVAIEFDEIRNRYYMMDLPNHTIHILHAVTPSKQVTLKSESTELSN